MALETTLPSSESARGPKAWIETTAGRNVSRSRSPCTEPLARYQSGRSAVTVQDGCASQSCPLASGGGSQEVYDKHPRLAESKGAVRMVRYTALPPLYPVVIARAISRPTTVQILSRSIIVRTSYDPPHR